MVSCFSKIKAFSEFRTNVITWAVTPFGKSFKSLNEIAKKLQKKRTSRKKTKRYLSNLEMSKLLNH